MNTQFDKASRLFGRLGKPAVWANSLRWCCVQEHVINLARSEIEPLALAMDQATPLNGFSRTLAAATHSWQALLAGASDRDRDSVRRAADDLRSAGLGYDAAALIDGEMTYGGEHLPIGDSKPPAVQVSRVPRTIVSRLEPPDGSSPQRVFLDEAGARSVECILSSRELQVAKLLLLNQAYREIGAQLFISSKTVEHHVARMKRRIGASKRSELFAQLRSLTADQ